MQSGITAEEWRNGDERDLETALLLLYEQQEEIKRARKGR